MIDELPVVEDCSECGACCMEQESPPGYAMLLSSPEMMENADLLTDDVERIRALPKEAIAELRQYMEQLLAGVERPDRVCLWLDRETMTCRYHEYRPMICRDFEIGSDECHAWRQDYGIDG